MHSAGYTAMDGWSSPPASTGRVDLIRDAMDADISRLPLQTSSWDQEAPEREYLFRAVVSTQ
jgi:hypothetical protein